MEDTFCAKTFLEYAKQMLKCSGKGKGKRKGKERKDSLQAKAL